MMNGLGAGLAAGSGRRREGRGAWARGGRRGVRFNIPARPRPPRLQPREPPLGGLLIRGGCAVVERIDAGHGSRAAFESAVEVASRCDTDRCQIAGILRAPRVRRRSSVSGDATRHHHSNTMIARRRGAPARVSHRPARTSRWSPSPSPRARRPTRRSPPRPAGPSRRCRRGCPDSRGQIVSDVRGRTRSAGSRAARARLLPDARRPARTRARGERATDPPPAPGPGAPSADRGEQGGAV